jgi:soluble lytic murein transglycosylase-like protein
MRIVMLFLILAAGRVTLRAADPPRPANPGAAAPAASTVKPGESAAAAMAASLAAQRSSIAQQMGGSPADSFFLLPPPAPGNPPLRPAPAGDCAPLRTSELDTLIDGAAKQEDLQPELLRSLIRQESGFQPCAVSPKGAIGLTQLMPATAAALGVRDPFDPKQSIDGGARFLKQMLTMFNDLPMALGAYNAGPGRVSESGGVPDIPETRNYVQRILSSLPINY